jgi:hypothetical protein
MSYILLSSTKPINEMKRIRDQQGLAAIIITLPQTVNQQRVDCRILPPVKEALAGGPRASMQA